MAKKIAERDGQFITMKFFMGLNGSFTNIRSQILLMNHMPSLNQIFHLVCLEEKQRMSTIGVSSETEGIIMQFKV